MNYHNDRGCDLKHNGRVIAALAPTGPCGAGSDRSSPILSPDPLDPNP